MQSLTLPMQGFLNAIVYGWTRKEFVQNMALLPQDLREEDNEIEYHRIPKAMAKKNKKKINSSDSLLYSKNMEENIEDSYPSTTVEALTDVDA